MLIHLEQQNAKPLVKWKDLLSGQWKGPDPLLTSSRGCACIFPQDTDALIWIPDRLICHYFEGHSSAPAAAAAAAAARNSHVPGTVGGASLADQTQRAAPSGRRGKINIEILVGLTELLQRKL